MHALGSALALVLIYPAAAFGSSSGSPFQVDAFRQGDRAIISFVANAGPPGTLTYSLRSWQIRRPRDVSFVPRAG